MIEGSNPTNLHMHTGKVKWFNNKSGYGFISFLDETTYKDKDIFVHHSSLSVKSELYKYLVQGEYVEFGVQKMDSKDHEFQAVNITGIKSNDLMCETRHKNRDPSKSTDFIGVKSVKKHRENHREKP
jgi:cold shock CspA family protein